jgi:two-component system, sensor histidine kinase and response regulator
MGGFELAERIRADPTLQCHRLVLLTALGQRGDALRARELGIAAYLIKPVREAQLFECLRLVMGTAGEPRDRSMPDADLITAHRLAERHAKRWARILVADDNVINQKVTVRFLEQLGCQVDVVPSGRLAVEAVTHRAYDLVLMDCQMPEMEGSKATEEIRLLEGRQAIASRREVSEYGAASSGSGGKPSKIPIIALKASVRTEDRDRCLRSGMDDYLTRPFSVEELQAMIDHWLPMSSCDAERAGGRRARVGY